MADAAGSAATPTQAKAPIAGSGDLSDEDRTYFHRRAEEEVERARTSVTERLVQFHYVLAGLYLDRVFGAEGDPRRAAGDFVAAFK